MLAALGCLTFTPRLIFRVKSCRAQPQLANKRARFSLKYSTSMDIAKPVGWTMACADHHHDDHTAHPVLEKHSSKAIFDHSINETCTRGVDGLGIIHCIQYSQYCSTEYAHVIGWALLYSNDNRIAFATNPSPPLSCELHTATRFICMHMSTKPMSQSTSRFLRIRMSTKPMSQSTFAELRYIWHPRS